MSYPNLITTMRDWIEEPNESIHILWQNLIKIVSYIAQNMIDSPGQQTLPNWNDQGAQWDEVWQLSSFSKP